MDDVMLPGFRFHPTDEELVGFYLKKKIQQRVLPIELIKQVDIYKYDPWDLPDLAPTGEKEWYFYCPRDRKYRNSARPNRVTGAGFWKATGTDRPIYSSDGTSCIGLKKSLVFYRGRAAKGIKTDWMMHEFRLPALSQSQSQSSPPNCKKMLDKSLPPNDAWAICRIFRKTSSIAQRALSHSWASEHHSSDVFNLEKISCMTDQLCNNNDPTLDSPDSISMNPAPFSLPQTLTGFPSGFMFSTVDISTSPMLFNHLPVKTCESMAFGGPQKHVNNISMNLRRDMGAVEDDGGLRKNSDPASACVFPFSLPSSVIPDDWNLNMPLAWDSPSETYSTNKCYID